MRYLLTLILSCALLVSSCRKEERGDTMLRIYLGDNLRVIPFNAEAVNIEIQGVKIKYQGPVADANSNDPGNSEDWVWLNTKPAVYNLVDLFKGNVMQISSGPVPGATVKEIRFVLGKNNSVKMDGVTIPINLPANSEYGFKIAAVMDLAVPIDSLTIDFNTAKSIQRSSSGQFALNPAFAIR